MGLVPLSKRPREVLRHSTTGGGTVKDTKSEPSPDSEFATALFLDVRVSRTMIFFSKKCIITNHPVNGILLEQPGQTKTLVYR